MIHQFQTKNAAPVIMLDDLTHRIFQVIGRAVETKGILLPEQIPTYIERLETAIEAERIAKNEVIDTDEDEQAIRQDPLGRRAYPFLELLRLAHKNHEPIVWGVNY